MTRTNSILEYAGIAWTTNNSNEEDIEDIEDYDEIVNFDEEMDEEMDLPSQTNNSGWRYVLPAFMYTAISYVSYLLFKKKGRIVYKNIARRIKKRPTRRTMEKKDVQEDEIDNYCK